VIADLAGKAGHVRTVPVPTCCKQKLQVAVNDTLGIEPDRAA
jgi:hypothetical protein